MSGESFVVLGARRRGADGLLKLARHLHKINYTPVVDKETRGYLKKKDLDAAGIETHERGRGRQPILAVALGGDGAFIQHATRYAPLGIPLIGVNFGHVGFLTDIPASKMEEVIEDVLRGKYTDEQRVMLDIRHVRGSKTLLEQIVINDVVIDRSARGNIINLEVLVDRKKGILLRGDGVIIATPGGSTAYNMAAGGPIIVPDADCISMTPLNPYSLTHRPLVFATHHRITVRSQAMSTVRLITDGIDKGKVELGDEIRISTHRRTMTVRHPSRYSYFGKLRDKLYWRNA